MVTVAILGLGPRGGDVYGTYAHMHNEKFKIVAICDRNQDKLKKFQNKFALADNQCYISDEALFSAGKIADVMFICTQDKDHFEHAMRALNEGYHLLLEKPISDNAKECLLLAEIAEQKKRIVIVCHVLRYTPYFQKIKELIGSGIIGEIKGIEHTESVGAWHYCHSYVRGNWCNTEKSSEMILAKCSHDFDILNWLLGKRCQTIYSVGELTFFKKDNMPSGASERCLACAFQDTCSFSAKRIYLSNYNGQDCWPQNAVIPTPSVETLTKALREGDYGRCVFASDNNVVDYQTVTMQYENNTYVSLTMTGFTQNCYRRTAIHGTHGEIEAKDLGNQIILYVYGEEMKRIELDGSLNPHAGHNGGDDGLMAYLYEAIAHGNIDETKASLLGDSIHSHILAKAAEQSRISGKPIIINEFEKAQI